MVGFAHYGDKERATGVADTVLVNTEVVAYSFFRS
jgi:hypothetical protein